MGDGADGYLGTRDGTGGISSSMLEFAKRILKNCNTDQWKIDINPQLRQFLHLMKTVMMFA